MSAPRTAFAVVYRWRLHPGAEEAFIAAWAALTIALRELRGGRGSRLHRAEDGTWVAYAQWPSRTAWEVAQAGGPVDASASAAMAGAIAETFAPVLLDPVRDLLARG